MLKRDILVVLKVVDEYYVRENFDHSGREEVVEFAILDGRWTVIVIV